MEELRFNLFGKTKVRPPVKNLDIF